MAKIQNFRFKCRNQKCMYEGYRAYNLEEYDRLQYGGTKPGIACFQCGYPQMAAMRSKRLADDKFKPGYQRNIKKYCRTYAEYQAHIKEMGLIELWYEDLPDEAFNSDTGSINYWNDKTLKMLYRNGVSLSGNEAEALKKGLI